MNESGWGGWGVMSEGEDEETGKRELACIFNNKVFYNNIYNSISRMKDLR